MKYLFAAVFVMKVFLMQGMEPIEANPISRAKNGDILRVRVGQKVAIEVVRYGNIHPCLFVDHPEKSILGFEGTDSVSSPVQEMEHSYNSNLRNTLIYMYTAIKPGIGTLAFWIGERTDEHKQKRTIIVEP